MNNTNISNIKTNSKNTKAIRYKKTISDGIIKKIIIISAKNTKQ